MKRFMIIISAAMLCSSCMLDDGNNSRHTARKLEEYASLTFNKYVLNPADKINLFLQLDDYINASEEERLSDRFSYLRDGLVRSSQNVYHVYYSGAIDTNGKSFRDPSGTWENDDITYTTIAEDTWHVSRIGVYDIDATIKDTGAMEDGRHILEVTMNASEEAGVYATEDRYGEIPVTASISTPEGPVTLYETFVEDAEHTTLKTLQADGVFCIDIFREGKPLDWVRMKFLPVEHMTISYQTSLD